MSDLWDALKKNKPLLIAVLAGIGIFLYVIYKNGPGQQAAPTQTGGTHTTYVEGAEVHIIPGPPGPKGPKGPKPKDHDVTTRKAGTLESAPHVPIYHGGQIVTVPAGARVQLTGTQKRDSAGKNYFQVIWEHMTGFLGGDVVSP